MGAVRCTTLWLSMLAVIPASAQAQPAPRPTVLATTVAPRVEIAPEPPATEPPAPEPEARESASRSIGVADRGRLREGVELRSTPHLFVREGRRRATYGTEELVGLLTRAVAQVHLESGGPRLAIGDLSGPYGGRLSPHRSHRSGRDADVGFYLVDGEGRAIEAPQFIQIRRNGCGQLRGVRYCFDPARNWSLLAALVSDPSVPVQYVLVAPDLRRRVLDEGVRRGAPRELLDRVTIATQPHSGSHSHRSHFHVRIYCSVDDRPECIDEPPYHAWYEGAPSTPPPEVRARRARDRRVARARQARIRARAAARRRARAE